MRVDLDGPIEDTVRRISTQLGISGNRVNAICMEMLIENIPYDDMIRIIKMTINKAVIQHSQRHFPEEIK